MRWRLPTTGCLKRARRNHAIRHGLNTFDGNIAHPAVAEATADEISLAVGAGSVDSVGAVAGIVTLLAGLQLTIAAGLEAFHAGRDKGEIAV